jgi:hypothetical protein
LIINGPLHVDNEQSGVAGHPHEQPHRPCPR